MLEFKIVISEKGKSYAKSLTNEESEVFLNKKIKDKINGNDFSFKDYEFEITGGSDKEGFPMRYDVEGLARRRIFVTKGMIGARINKKGLRIKKAVRGNTISQFTSQINLKVIKSGQKNLDEIFVKAVKEEKPAKKPKEIKKEKIAEEKPKEIKEIKKEEPKIEKKEIKEEKKVEKVEKVKEPKETDRIGYTEENVKKAQELLSKLQEEKIKEQEKASQKNQSIKLNL